MNTIFENKFPLLTLKIAHKDNIAVTVFLNTQANDQISSFIKFQAGNDNSFKFSLPCFPVLMKEYILILKNKLYFH